MLDTYRVPFQRKKGGLIHSSSSCYILFYCKVEIQGFEAPGSALFLVNLPRMTTNDCSEEKQMVLLAYLIEQHTTSVSPFRHTFRPGCLVRD